MLRNRRRAPEPTATSGDGQSLWTLARQTFVYGVSGAALQLIGLMTLPVFARVFNPAQYGVIELGNVTYSFLMVLTDAGLASASQRSYYDYGEDDRTARGTVLTTAAGASIVVGAVIAGAMALTTGPLGHALFRGSDHATILLVIAFTLPVTAACQFTREAMRLHFRAWHYVVSAVLAAVVSAAVSLLEVLTLGSGVVGLFVGTLAGTGAALLYGVAVMRHAFQPRVSAAELRRMVAYGLPLILPGLSVWGLSFVDRFLLGALSNLSEVGEYAIANRVAGIVLFLATAIATAFSPFILSLYAEDPSAERRVRARTLTAVTLVLVSVSVVLGLFGRELILVIAPAFRSAYESVGLLVMGTTAFGLTSIVMFGIALTRRTVWTAVYSGLAAAANVSLNLILIPFTGQVGSAVATAVGFGILAVLYYRKSQQLYPTPFELRRVLRIFGLSVPPLGLGLVRIHPLALSLGIKAVVLVLFFVMLRVTHAFTAEELEALVALARRRLPARAAS